MPPRAETVIGGDLAIDAARERIEDESFDILARQAPVAGDLRMLVAAASDGHRPGADG